MSNGLSPSGIKIIMNNVGGLVDGHGAAIDRLVASRLVHRGRDGAKTLTEDGWAAYKALGGKEPVPVRDETVAVAPDAGRRPPGAMTRDAAGPDQIARRFAHGDGSSRSTTP